MKYIICITASLFSLTLYGQDTKTPFDGHNWEAPYHLPIPKDWTIERFLIPISFAPQIRYQGVEDIRFTPGWGKVNSDGYWTYAFLWYLDGSPKTDAKIIAGNLKAYYTGLIRSNTDSTRAASEKWMPVTTAFKKVPADKGDIGTYTGTINMRDFIQRNAIKLYCKVHIRACTDEQKTVLFYELSPKPFAHPNWKGLDQLWLDFTCKRAGTPG